MKSRRRKSNIKISFFSFLSHSIIFIMGCFLGIYALTILTAPRTPTNEKFKEALTNTKYEGFFVKNLEGSNFLYWGKGQIALSKNMIIFQGKLSPGPDYKLYLTKKFIQNNKDFLKIKDKSLLVGDVRSFQGFILKSDQELDLASYNSIVIWSELFSVFITSAKYK